MTREGCSHPQNTARTAYNKGCRCDGCREAEAEKARRYREAHREAIAEKARRYREANREAIAEKGRRYREANYKACRRAVRMRREKYARLLPATVSGPFSPAEDKVILAWEGTVVQLAAALGRTYAPVQQRQASLRKRGLLP